MSEEVCNAFMWGEFNPLRCCRQKGHDGDHNYVVVGPSYSKSTNSFYNTTHSHGALLAKYEGTARSQEDRVFKFFVETEPHCFTPEDIGRRVLPETPRTSWGRAITNLTKNGLLEKTNEQVKGAWGKPIYRWRLRPLPAGISPIVEQPRLL